MTLPAAQPITSIAPTELGLLSMCPLRLAFKRSIPKRTRRQARPTPPQLRLGSVAHRVLERLVSTRELFGENLDQLVEAAWNGEIARERTEADAAGDVLRHGEPESWPGYYVKLATLNAMAARLADLLVPLEPEADYRTEEPLTDPYSPLWGIPDLVVRSHRRSIVIDYKSGSGIDSETGDIRSDYKRQVQLYSYLEHQDAGVWPDEGWLLPFQGPPIKVDVSDEACSAAVETALGAVQAYNEAAGTTPHAKPSASACRYCGYVSRCPEFWTESARLVEEGLVAVRGEVTDKRTTRLGGVTLVVNPEPPSAFSEVTSFRRIDPIAHPVAALVEAGDSVCLVGVRNRSAEADAPFWELGRSGAVHAYARVADPD